MEQMNVAWNYFETRDVCACGGSLGTDAVYFTCNTTGRISIKFDILQCILKKNYFS